jgi:pre-mRNA-splicing helicase BRR2
MVSDSRKVRSEMVVSMQMQLRVQLDRQRESGPVCAPRYPAPKQEMWWLIVGDGDDNLLAIKRVTLGIRHQSTLSLEALPQGKHELKLMFMCDSYLGCDQEYPFIVHVGTGGHGMEEG